MFSSTIDPIDLFPVGQHPLVRKLLKGIYLSNPPRAKYASTWNVDDVLGHIDSLGRNSELSIALLSEKKTRYAVSRDNSVKGVGDSRDRFQLYSSF